MKSRGGVPLKGSMKRAMAQARITGEAPGGEFQVTIMVRRKKELPSLEAHARQKPRERTYMTREECAANHGASAEDLRAVEIFAHDHGLNVVNSDAAKRSVIVSGTAAQFNEAFGVELETYQAGDVTYRGREGEIYLPPSISGIVTSVTGLDNRPFAKPHFRIGREKAVKSDAAIGRRASASVPAGFSPPDLAKLYQFPDGFDGTGETVAILELGGGFHTQELATYFQQIGVAKAPQVVAAKFTGAGSNRPGTNALDPNNPDIEVMLDIEVIGSIAPGAKIVVYFAPDATDQSFLNAMNAIVNDATNKPSIASISWGGPEDSATSQFKDDFDQILQSAAQIGITVCAASGDSGSADFASDDPNWDHQAHVDFPASSPHILACGGTKIAVSATAISSEVVWDDGANDGSGGGVSRYFALPTYQQNAGVPNAVNPAGAVMRGVPDVSGDAAPDSGYRVLCDGTPFPDPSEGLPPVGGTSAVAPLWSGLFARVNQAIGKPAGFVNTVLYSLPTSANAFRDITSGSNGDYKAKAGWDPCTGLGSPVGKNILTALQ